jgi:type 1 fimbria pilin
MNRSKIFLGVTTCLLAVAGVAAAKRFGSSITRWYVTANSHCVVSPAITCTQFNGKPQTCTVALGSNPTKHFKIYTQGTVGQASNCLNYFTYTAAN